MGFGPNHGGGLFCVTGGVDYARMRHQLLTTNTVNQFTTARDHF